MTALRSRKVILITAIAVVLQGMTLALMAYAGHVHSLNIPRLTGDANGYAHLAENLLRNHAFSIVDNPPFTHQSFRTPGYPVFLAALLAIFQSWWAVLIVQALMLCAVPPLLYLYLRRWHEPSAFIAACIFAIEPIRLYLSATLLTDALFAGLFLLTLLVLERTRTEYRMAFVLGFVCGIATLIRPISQFLPLVYIAYLALSSAYVWRIRFAAIGLMCISFALVVLPWSYRNFVYFGAWELSAVSSANLAFYNAPEFLKFRPDIEKQRAFDAFLKEQVNMPSEDAYSLAREGRFREVFRSTIQGHEFEYAFFHVLKTIPFFVTDGLRDTLRLFRIDTGQSPNITGAIMDGNSALIMEYVRQGGLPIVLLFVGSLFWTAVTLLFGIEVLSSLWRREWIPIVFVTILVGYFAILTGPVSNARYRLPVEGLLLYGAARTVFRINDAYRERREIARDSRNFRPML